MIIESAVDTTSEEFQENARHNRALLAEIQRRTGRTIEGGRDAAIARHRDRGKLLPRERIACVCDPDVPFLELSALCAETEYGGASPGAGIVTGIGVVEGTEIMFVANDATIKGGTYFPLTVAKHLRAQQIAEENRLPCVYLVDSGGAYLPLQAEIFPHREGFGRIFFNMARMSAAGIPQLAVVFGSCTAGGAYVPAMADQTVIVRGAGTIFLGGPPLVRAATGEVVSAEELGGADVHGRESGLVDYVVDSEVEGLQLTRSLIRGWRIPGRSGPRHAPVEPRYDPEDLYGLIPTSARKRLPMLEILARLVDDSDFEEFKPLYGETLLCGFATIMGEPVGIVANNGILFAESAEKGAHFVQLCDRRNIPLLFLHDIVGFMVGKAYERAGIAKAGAKLVNAVACCSVPKLSLIVGASHGAGNYAMAGRAYDPRLLWSWPNARISVMGGQEAANVLTTIGRDAALAKGQAIDEVELARQAEETIAKYEAESNAIFATAHLWDDGVIDPRRTSVYLGLALTIVKNSPIAMPDSHYGIFRM